MPPSTARARLSRAAILAASAAGIVIAGADCGGQTQGEGESTSSTSSATSASTGASSSSSTSITSSSEPWASGVALYGGIFPPPPDGGRTSVEGDAAAAADADARVVADASQVEDGSASDADTDATWRIAPPYGRAPIPEH